MSDRCVFVLRRRADITSDAFHEIWRGSHAELVKAHAATLGLVGYTQLHTVRGDRMSAALRLWRGLREPYDGIDVWWLDRAAFAAALDRPEGLAALEEIIESERRFVDHGKSAAWLAQAHLFRDALPAGRDPGRKLVWVGFGVAPQTNREFQEHYLRYNGPLVAHSAAQMGIHRYLQVHTVPGDPLTERLRALRGTGEPYPVSAELTWNIADVFRGGGRAGFAARAIAKDERERIDFARSAIWYAEERVVIEPPALELSRAAQAPMPDVRARREFPSLKGKVAVVTGAASGIGRAVALELATRGCHVALVTRRNRQGLEDTAAQVRAHGTQASVHLADTSQRAAMEALPQAVHQAHGAVHILVNSAGIAVFGDYEDQSLESIEEIVGTNLFGVLYGCKFFLPYIKREGWGHICNVSSLQGLLALTGQSTYAATKFAVRGFSEALRGELAPHGVGVSCVFPGMIRTDIVASARAESRAASELRASLVRYVDKHAMDPARCARQIVQAIERNDARVLITPETRIFDALKRLFPTGVDQALARLTKHGLPEFV